MRAFDKGIALPSGYGRVKMNRRQFFSIGAAGAAMLARLPNSFAASYDMVIKGGRIIDPSLGINATGDVAITGGRGMGGAPPTQTQGGGALAARRRSPRSRVVSI